MNHRKRLYNIAKQSGKSEDWAAYCSTRNSVNSQLECAHNAYYGQLFDDSFAGNRRQLWKYIQARHKEPSEVSTLLIDNQSVSDSKGKAITLSNQFLPEKTCQMCLFWRQTPVSKPCPPFHLMSMGSKTCCLPSILIKPRHSPDGISPYSYTQKLFSQI